MQYQKIVELVGDSQFTLGGYWPVATEYDVRPLMEVHLAAEQRVCLPAVIEADQPLKFYPYQQGDPLEVGAFKVPHPVLKGQKDILPDVVLCPLLAFDCSGHRLGYGGGFYDRTLAFLRAQKPGYYLHRDRLYCTAITRCANGNHRLSVRLRVDRDADFDLHFKTSNVFISFVRKLRKNHAFDFFGRCRRSLRARSRL